MGGLKEMFEFGTSYVGGKKKQVAESILHTGGNGSLVLAVLPHRYTNWSARVPMSVPGLF